MVVPLSTLAGIHITPSIALALTAREELMGHYALVVNNIVQQVIVADSEFINDVMQPQTEEGQWIKTSYNTRGGVHYEPDSFNPSADQSKALRYNFAGTGSIYYPDADAFSSPPPYPSWVLDTTTYQWQPPVPFPPDYGDGVSIYGWDEEGQQWVEISA
jgi:hypothetical protein